MAEPLHFPVTTPPAPGEIIPIAPGVLWLRMKLPFALDHINLWLIEDGPSWTAVDTGFTLPETKAAWQQIFARGARRPQDRPGLRDALPSRPYRDGWLPYRALAGAVMDD